MKKTNSRKTALSYEDTASAKNDDMKLTAKNLKGKSGIRRIKNAARYSLDGFRAAYKNEAAFRQLFWINSVLFILILILPFSAEIKSILIIASFLSLMIELINTGLEASIDYTSTDIHVLAKIGKDVGSAAQFLALMLLFVLWSIALYSI